MSTIPTHLHKVALIGATGQIGSHILTSLLATGMHTITALTRQSSPSTTSLTPHPSLTILPVDYTSTPSLTSALSGHDILIITLSARAPKDLHPRIVAAAVEAGIKFIMPNYFGAALPSRWPSTATSPTASPFLEYIADVQKYAAQGVAYIALCCGFWYEFSLGMGEAWLGVDFEGRKVTMFDDGMTRVSMSTWRSCGEVVARVLSLPVDREEGETGAVVRDYADGGIYVADFLVSQREIFESVNRVLGTREGDWEVGFQSTKDRYEEGARELQDGVMTGFAKMLYARGLEKSGLGDFETGFELDNVKLGMKKEDLDVVTKRALDMVDSGFGIRS